MNGILKAVMKEIQYFGYPHLLADRVAQEIKKKDATLASVWIMLSNVEVALADTTKALDSSCKIVKELEANEV